MEDIELEPGAERVELATVRKLNRPADNDPVFLAHAGHPRILSIVESMIGPDIKLYNSQCFMKPPGRGGEALPPGLGLLRHRAHGPGDLLDGAGRRHPGEGPDVCDSGKPPSGRSGSQSALGGARPARQAGARRGPGPWPGNAPAHAGGRLLLPPQPAAASIHAQPFHHLPARPGHPLHVGPLPLDRRQPAPSPTMSSCRAGNTPAACRVGDRFLPHRPGYGPASRRAPP